MAKSDHIPTDLVLDIPEDLESENLAKMIINFVRGVKRIDGGRHAIGWKLLRVKRREDVLAPPRPMEEQPKPADYHDIGKIEGRFKVMEDVRKTFVFEIVDTLRSRPVKCNFPEELLDQAMRHFRRRERVEVGGLIHYRPDGTAVSIEVETLEVLPIDDELPGFDDVRGILAHP